MGIIKKCNICKDKIYWCYANHDMFRIGQKIIHAYFTEADVHFCSEGELRRYMASYMNIKGKSLDNFQVGRCLKG